MNGSRRAANRIAFVAIVLAVAAAGAWALYFPVFQAPDEDNHYDYALMLRTALRAPGPAEGPPQNDAHPYVRYLLDATGGVGLRFDPLSREPAGYGTAEFWRGLDRHAPHLDPAWRGAGPMSPVPYLARAYPIGYYAAAAGAIALGDTIVPHSITAEFFAARLFSVVCLGLTLALWWRVLRCMEIGPRAALAVLVLSAFTPIVLQTFSSVQPDCLVAVLVAAIALVALTQRRDGMSARGLATLGVLFALLCITKRHYAVAAALPAAAGVLSAAWVRGARVRRLAVAGALLFVPSLIGWLLTSPLLRTAASGLYLCPAEPARPLLEAIGSALRALPNHTALFVVSALLGGESMQRFWLAFGWYMEPVTLGAPWVTSAALVAAGGFSVAIAVLTGWRIARNAIRIGAIARTSPALAASLAAANVPLNMLLLYIAVLIAALSFTDGSITLQGRYWLPFVPVIWYAAVCLAPGALSPRPATFLRATVLAGSAVLIAAALWFTPQSVAARFFEAPARTDPQREIYAAFDVDGKRRANADFGAVAPGGTLDVAGFAVDLRSAGPVAAAELQIDDGPAVTASPAARPQFACDYVSLSLLNAGFTGRVKAAGLAPGAHRLAVLVRPAWSTAFLDTRARGTFVVTP